MGYRTPTVVCESGCTPKNPCPRLAGCEAGLRFLNTSQGRWASRDPLGEAGWTESYPAMRFPMSREDAEGAPLLFVGNDPNERIDFMGALGMDTVLGPSDTSPWYIGGLPPCRRCGGLFWIVDFVTDKGQSEINGWIIQEVKLRMTAKTCALGGTVGNAPGYPVNFTFYEAFQVTDSSDPRDGWVHAGPGCCTFGIKKVEGTAAFFWIDKLPSTFARNNPAVAPYTTGPATTVRPWFFGLKKSWISNYITRKLQKNWVCCPDETYSISAHPLEVP